MIKLTDRLKSIAEEINLGETVADIGTDHGFLPVYLWERKISPKVIMTDLSPESLDKARTNCKEAYPDQDFDLRQGDGLKVIKPGEVDAVVMAGMGGILMSEMLGDDKPKAKSFKKLVLQPRSNIGMLRHWLFNNGFSISNEKLVREGKYICEILTVLPKEVAITRAMGPERIEYQYPHSLLDFKGPLTEEYLKGKLGEERYVLKSMEESTKLTPAQLRSQSYRVEYLERLISKL